MQVRLNKKMDNFATRVKSRRKELGLNQIELAQRSGLQQSDISKIESGRVQRTTAIVQLAKALQCAPEWLLLEQDSINGGITVGEPQVAYNVNPIAAGRRVPLISEVQAGTWSDISDPFQPGEADEWVTAYQARLSKHAFALEVTGDSMTAPAGISFPAGTVIFVDPDRASSVGDFVVAKDVITQRATFKKLVTDGGRWFLKPLNPAYPMIEIDDPALRVIGRVMEYQNSGKL